MHSSIAHFVVFFAWIGAVAALAVVLMLGSHAGPINVEYGGGEAVQGGEAPAEPAP
jgi:hypothetical protein